MQLNKPRIRRNLGLITANLFLATHGYSQELSGASSAAGKGPLIDQPVSDLGTATLDTSVMFYNEKDGRVRVTEPVTRLSVTSENGSVFTASAIYDSLSGATPNGAAPWSQAQTFTTPTGKVTNTTTTQTVTSASGNRSIITVPGTTTQVAQYKSLPGQLPVDRGFKDSRNAYNLGYAAKWDENTIASIGYSTSSEHDYHSHSENLSLSRDFDHHNTTVLLGASIEHDESKPIFGTPTPMTEMNGNVKGAPEKKRVTSYIVGVTQVINKRWLMQVNYEEGRSKGYQNDPYRIISVIDPSSGAPQKYLYENRPRTRVRRSIYIANKVAVGPTAADISFRFYHDSWGVRSITSSFSERIPFLSRFYVQPELRFYHQSAAKFFHYYLLSGQTTPDVASADGRLSNFTARTVGLRLGFALTRNFEIYMMAEDYKQKGENHLPNAPGHLSQLDFFSGVHARSYVMGFKYRFRLFKDTGDGYVPDNQ